MVNLILGAAVLTTTTTAAKMPTKKLEIRQSVRMRCAGKLRFSKQTSKMEEVQETHTAN